ncbi:hypothetical protein PVAP13_1KG330215 [Panicum virgatum]|uniref:Uncharacterized protein n=1 Tax=Panicum virgatum TaxID=38727 RepID=A0A8T0XJC0_PANVG|nr:hypothetical protein PVAP13_1KG330215 [Panicum virgatum]
MCRKWGLGALGEWRSHQAALPHPLAGATPLTPPGAHQAARVQAGRASVRCEVEGARGGYLGSGCRRSRTREWIPTPGCGRAAAARLGSRHRAAAAPPPPSPARLGCGTLPSPRRDWIRFCVGWVGIGPSGCFRRGSQARGGGGGEREWGWRGPAGWELVGRAGGGGLVRFGCD